MTWRFIATRLNGDGTETHLDPEAPLRDVQFTEYRNAPTEISATIDPESLDLKDAAGLDVFRKWSTAIYPEKDGQIRAGGILVDDSVDGPSQSLDFFGFAGYPNGQPYTERDTWPANPPETEVDPLIDAEVPANVATVAPVASTRAVYNPKTKTTTVLGAQEVTLPPAAGGFASTVPVQWPSPTAAPNTTDYPADGMEPMFGIREIWRHLQSQTRGNLGVQIDPMVTGRKIGKLILIKDIDTENGPLALEYNPFTLSWFKDFDLGEVIDKLCQDLPLEYREEHSWDETETAITHFIRFGYPRLGSRRSDVRFIIGENVDPVLIDPPGDEYASHVIGLGAGDGRDMPRADAYRSDEDRIRRAVVFEDKSARTAAAINLTTQAELLARIGVDEVTTIVARPGSYEELAMIMPGDEVWLGGEQAHRDLDMYVRVESKTTICDTDALEFEVQRTDRLP